MQMVAVKKKKLKINRKSSILSRCHHKCFFFLLLIIWCYIATYMNGYHALDNKHGRLFLGFLSTLLVDDRINKSMQTNHFEF